MLEFTQGDMFEKPADIRVNTVNCVGVMGAGVALAFKQRFPEMFRDYQMGCKDGRVRPGRMHVWKSLEGDWVVNFPTKRDWRDPSRYEDIDAGLDDLRGYLESVGPVTVALPALGCGHGGLDWDRVSAMIRTKLDGIAAHVMVFAPAASRQAGRSASELPSDDERASAEQLGYQISEPESFPRLQVSKPIFVRGDVLSLSEKWVALLPSRTPGEREMQALRTIASELARSGAGITIALVHGARISEEIAQIFTNEGIDTVLILPFGVLTRKTIAKPLVDARRGSLTLVSSSPPSTKWSRQLFGEAQEILRTNAAAMLLSDPEPEWLTEKGLSKWAGTPISYVRYETTPHHMRDALASEGARPIGRSGDNGAPNIDHLMGTFGPKTESMLDASGEDVETEQSLLGHPPMPTLQNDLAEPPEVVTIALDGLSDSARRELLQFLMDASVSDLSISFGTPSALTEAERRRLKSFSLN